MSRNRQLSTRQLHSAPSQPPIDASAHDIFEERPNERRRMLQQRFIIAEQNERLRQQQQNHRRQMIAGYLAERHHQRLPVNVRDGAETEDADYSSEDEVINERDFCWYWDEKSKSNDVLIQNCGTEAFFHPDYSCGTAAIRGDKQFREGEEHYWEVQMSSAVYGTDMMIGVGCASVDLNKYKSQFCSIIGKDAESWGISYFGSIHHNGKTKNDKYGEKFERGTIIGCHLDLWKGTLSFYKDGIPLGIAFDGLLGKKLFPIISSTAARTRMKLLCSYKTSFSLQYLCCKEISKHIPSSNTEALQSLPIPNGLKRYISWRMDWVLKLNNPQRTHCIGGPRRKRVRKKTKEKTTPIGSAENNSLL